MSCMSDRSIVEALYELITEDEDESYNEETPSEQATDAPKNFLLNTLNGMVTKLGEQLASPGLVLTWLLAAVGAPAFLAGLLVPVRRSIALLPQLAIAGQMRKYGRRK